MSELERFSTELEFVQLLANPAYLSFLAKHGYFKKPEFVNYLEYLQYWTQPRYLKFIRYPQCLHFLKLLQTPEFRDNLTKYVPTLLLYSVIIFKLSFLTPSGSIGNGTAN